jgi:hypothetical protein
MGSCPKDLWIPNKIGMLIKTKMDTISPLQKDSWVPNKTEMLIKTKMDTTSSCVKDSWEPKENQVSYQNNKKLETTNIKVKSIQTNPSHACL